MKQPHRFGSSDSALFSPHNIQQWSSLTKSFEDRCSCRCNRNWQPKTASKKHQTTKLCGGRFPYQLARDQKEVDKLEKKLLEQSPFFHGVLLNPNTEVYLTIITQKRSCQLQERELCQYSTLAQSQCLSSSVCFGRSYFGDALCSDNQCLYHFE